MRLLARLFAVASTLSVASGCTQSSTSLAEPSSSKCQITATNQPSAFPSAGGRGSVSIAATRDCTWSITANAPWVVIAGERTGLGEAVVQYTVSENPVPSARSAMLTVDAVELPLSQAAAPCTYSIAPPQASIDPAGGSLSFAVTTLSGCPWSAESQVAWITAASGASGNASATVGLAIAANPGAAREGAVSVAGHTFTVRQDAAGAPAPSPAPPAPPPSAPPPPSPPPPQPGPTPETVEFQGTILLLSGECPNIAFLTAGRLVLTNGQTEFRKRRCRDLSIGDQVKVRGTVTGNNPVIADRVEFRERDDDIEATAN